MEHTFWHERWETQQIAFHQDSVHTMLVEHLAQLGLRQGDRLFVPLCGKTLDIGWLLGEGFAVVGAAGLTPGAGA